MKSNLLVAALGVAFAGLASTPILTNPPAEVHAAASPNPSAPDSFGDSVTRSQAAPVAGTATAPPEIFPSARPYQRGVRPQMAIPTH